jgi:hypothetical protein
LNIFVITNLKQFLFHKKIYIELYKKEKKL